ncbi:MAG: cobalt-precorrin-6A reductase, partial [Candidatus Competibacteraceae bacterium]|nr:cobalt-precorrin-6A reductase [Candidatus Competibacteraceae bacterium]
LILGGIGEALKLAQMLTPTHTVVYSIVGKGRTPKLSCMVRVGGFGGVDGLAAFLHEQGITLLIDATHPYAAQMSQNAAQAARRVGILLWAYRRPPWRPEQGDDWRFVPDWTGMQAALAAFQRPFFTLGLEPLRHVAEIPPHQHWRVRCLTAEPPASTRLTLLCATGPFTLEQELTFMENYRIDVLVAKNSGGGAVEAKLAAARQLRISVVMLERPVPPVADQEFANVESIARVLLKNG